MIDQDNVFNECSSQNDVDVLGDLNGMICFLEGGLNMPKTAVFCGAATCSHFKAPTRTPDLEFLLGQKSLSLFSFKYQPIYFHWN